MLGLRRRSPSGRTLKRALAAGAVALCTAAVATGGPATAQTAPDKTRVYVVVVDGLRPDEVASMPFLSSLAAGAPTTPRPGR